MKRFNIITLPGTLSILSMLFLLSCGATIPEISLSKESLIKMELNREAFGITAISVSRDGKYLMTGDNGGSSGGGGKPSLRLWDLTEGKQIAILKDLSGTVTSIDISPDGRYAIAGGIALAGRSDTPKYPLSIWDLSTGKLLKSFESSQAGYEITNAGFSQDGRYFLITTLTSVKPQKTDIRVFEAKTWKLVKILTPPQEPGYINYLVATFSPDGKCILSGGPASVARLWDIETEREIRTFHGHKKSHWGGMASVAFSPDGKHALTGAWYDPYVRLWNVENGREVRRFASSLETDFYYKANVLGVAVSPDWKNALIVARNSRVVDIRTGELLTSFSHAWRGLKTVSREHGGWPAGARYHPSGRYILMTMTDAAMRIYDAKTGEEIAMMVGFDDGEWLAITSEGYYNSSEKGAQYLSVKIGEASYGVDKFYDVFYRPDIVAAKLRGDDIRDLITITMKDAIGSPPPVVAISPVTPSPASPKVKVCYNIKSTGGGIGEVRLFHNGKLIESDGFYKEVAGSGTEKTQLAQLDSRTIYEDMRSVKIKEKTDISPATAKTKGDACDDCREIDAVSGENEISITAFNRDNTVQGYMQTVKFTSTVKQEEPHLHILSIGIDRYMDNTVNLKYAVKDSADIEERLMKQASTLYKPQNIHYELLTDGNATKANITSKIAALSKKIKPTDSFILFVAGHGVLLQNQYYMLTHEFDGKVSEQAMISSNEIVEMSKKIKSLSQLFIFDTCHAGGVDYIVSGLYDARMSVLAKKMGLHIYASASGKQAALDGYKGNGLFTYTLLEGLNNRQEADSNHDRSVSLTELGFYSKQATTEISKTIGHGQTPLIINFGKDSPVYKLR